MTMLSASRIAALLGRPAPTAEQEAVITAPLAPGVVVAGAGSGKTETMAARVVWLVANDLVAPGEVLGLTFTRKAAAELAARVRRRLQALTDVLGRPSPLGEPTVSTYDAFAGRLVIEHGARLGLEPGRALLSPAGAWQRAARLVRGWDGAMDGVESAPDTVIADVLDLHEQSAAHLVDLDRVVMAAQGLGGLIESLPPGPRQRKPLHSRVEPVVRAQLTRARLVPLVHRYRDEMAADGLTDFASVAADAARIAARFGEAGQAMRDQYRLVLLDEFQDTSLAQLQLLLSLFGAGHPVTAVGDPFQSIYAWRGASSDTLTSFGEHFGADGRVPRYSLRTSFRNAGRILVVANAVAEPLRTGGQPVATLTRVDGAPSGEVRVSLHRTQSEQAQAVAEQVDREWRTLRPEASGPPSVGVLVRRRDEIPALEAALRERDLPVEVVGLDGLLTVPEVADTVALLQVAADPVRGDALIRLLTGPRLHLGPRDLDRLSRWARRLASEPVPGEQAWQVHRPGVADCLTEPPPRGWLSPSAAQRLDWLSGVVAELRERMSAPLAEVVADAIVLLGLDVESMARALRTGGAGAAHLERLVDEAAAFADLAPHAGIMEFLEYLAAAATQDRGLRRAQDVHLGTRVQVLTVHAAKGLEWDVVVVAGLVDGVFPASSRTSTAWLTDPGTLPYPLRGDAAHLPALDLGGVSDQSDLAAAVEAFVHDGRQGDLAEERRLAYVAVTRARQRLLCHGYRWGAGRRQPAGESAFLAEVAAIPEVAVDVWTSDPGEPPGAEGDPPVWPVDPLGRHRRALEDGAALVRRARMAEHRADRRRADLSLGRPGMWRDEVELLLAERSRDSLSPLAVRLPSHLSATDLVAARRHPEQFLDRLRRPMPLRPRVDARRGTAFHAWLEQRYGTPTLLDLDELPGAFDADAVPPGSDLAELQQAFLASQWAERTPLEVEAPFELVQQGVVIRGRADAVFADGDDLLVVDWKTGPPPTSPDERAARAAQLAAYRKAFAALYSLPVERVRAVFHHVRENLTIEGPAPSDDPLPAVLGVLAGGSAWTGGARPSPAAPASGSRGR